LGIARALGAVLFSIIIGLAMHFIFRREELEKARLQMAMPAAEVKRPLWQNGLFFASMIGILVFANWGQPTASSSGIWPAIYAYKWLITSFFALALAVMLTLWFGISRRRIILAAAPVTAAAFIVPDQPLIPFIIGVISLSLLTSQRRDEAGEWFSQSWGFTKQILPLLFFGVAVAGALLGRPGHEGLIPSTWINQAVGGNSLSANFVASFAGAFMYFATLTEVPILQGLIGNGMGKGPALALLLAGPALSLPNMLVIRSAMGTKKTVVFVTLVIVMSTITGILYGTFF